MATSMPALDATTHVASVTYACTFGLTTADGGLVSFMVPQPVQFTFGFETGQSQPDPDVDLYLISTDYTWFDQDQVEAGIVSALGTICSAIAALLGTDVSVIEATVTIERIWRINPDQVGSAAPVQIPDAPLIYTQPMVYPPAVAAIIAGSAGMGGSGAAGA
jgi:hypothetical protein